jgi:hypothetical protein
MEPCFEGDPPTSPSAHKGGQMDRSTNAKVVPWNGVYEVAKEIVRHVWPAMHGEPVADDI